MEIRKEIIRDQKGLKIYNKGSFFFLFFFYQLTKKNTKTQKFTNLQIESSHFFTNYDHKINTFSTRTMRYQFTI